MTMRTRAGSPRTAVALAVVGVLAVVAAALAVQDQRHGWPFSRHHGNAPHAPDHAPATRPTDALARAAVDVDAARLDEFGVRFAKATATVLAEPVRAVATVAPDESRVSHVHTRVSGWIERLLVNTTGQRVRAGEPLAEIFSQELFSSQREYLAARRAAQAGHPSAVLDAARERLDVLGMSAAEVREIERTGAPRRTFTVLAPHAGTVLRRGVSVGTAVDPSTDIVTVADLSQVWVLAEVPEAAADEIAEGMEATLDFPGSGRAPFAATVAFVYPTLTERTRQTRVRFAVANEDGRLPPGLYGTARFELAPREVLTVPRDAVVDTGDAQHVFVRAPSGTLEPRTVTLGVRHEDRIEIRSGLAAGDEVVAEGVFLIDSESRLQATGVGGHAGHGAGTPAEEKTVHTGHGN